MPALVLSHKATFRNTIPSLLYFCLQLIRDRSHSLELHASHLALIRDGVFEAMSAMPTIMVRKKTKYVEM